MQFQRKLPAPTFLRTVAPPKGKQDKDVFTPGQLKFIELMSIIGDNNGHYYTQRQAAIEAGYSPVSAHTSAYELMHNDRIRAEIDRRRELRLKKFNITADTIMQELASIAFANFKDFYKDDGSLRSITELPKHVSAALNGVDVQATIDDQGHPAVVQKIKLHDKIKSLELLGKTFKMWTERMEISNPEAVATSNDDKARETQAKLLQQMRDEEEADKEVESIVQQALTQ